MLRRCLPFSRPRCLCTAAAGVEGSAARLMKGRRIMAAGAVGDVHATAVGIAKSFGMLPRDLRLLATRSANLAVRPSYFIFRFPPFTGVVSSDQAVLIADNGGADAGGAGYSRELVKLATSVLEREIVGGAVGRDTSQPFEHRVLDAVLREDTVRKQERFARLSQQIELALMVRDRGAEHQRSRDRGGRRSMGLMSLGADKHAEAREHALYQLITLGEALEALQVEVRRAEACLDALLRADEDMAALYLSHARDAGERRAVADHEEVEILLEAAAMQLMDLDDQCDSVRARVKTHRTLEELKLRNERNRIMRFELLLSMGTISLTLAAVVGGFFGMNLHSGVEEAPGALWLAAGAATGVSASLLYVLTGGVRRFHRSQRAHLVHMGTLRRTLGHMDGAYYALRHHGLLAVSHRATEGEPGAAPAVAVSEGDFAEAMAAAGRDLDPQVWQLLSGEPLEAVDEPGVGQSVQVAPKKEENPHGGRRGKQHN